MSGIRSEFVSGVLYTSLAKYSNIAVQLVVTAILARILTPTDYGILAVATVFIAFFNIIGDIGIGPAIIQFKNLQKKDVENIFSFTVYLGILLSLLFFLSSGPISHFYGSHSLLYVCECLSLVVLFNCINIVPQNLQFKKKRFKFVAIVTFCSNAVTAIIAIILAFLDFGVYSIVFQQILSIVAITIANYSQDVIPFRFKFRVDSLRLISSFTLFQFLFNVVNYFSRNLDKFLVGRYIGVEPLGQYEKSYRLMLLPLQNITFAVTPVIQPILSNFQNDKFVLAEKYKKLFVFLSYIGFPLSIVCFFCGRELILLFFGHQWIGAIMPFKILSLSLGLQLLNGTSGAVYQSANATKRLFYSGCWCAFFMICGFGISIFFWKTIEAVAVGYLIAQLLNSMQTYYLLFKTLKYPIMNILQSMGYPFVISILIGVVVWLSSPFYDGLNLLFSLSVKVITSLTIWALMINWYGPFKGILHNRSFIKQIFS